MLVGIVLLLYEVELHFQANRPLVLDESINSLTSVISAHESGPGNILALKIGRLGGITKARQVSLQSFSCFPVPNSQMVFCKECRK